MRKITKYILLLLTVSTLISVSCTGDDLTDDNSIHVNLTLENWIKSNRPDIPKEKDGFFLKIESGGGTADTNILDTSVVGITYSVQSLTGNYAVNMDTLRAIELGTFSYKTNYVPFTFIFKDYESYNGICPGMTEAILKMKVGDTAEMYVTPEYGYGWTTEMDVKYLGFRGNENLAAGQIAHIKMSLDSVVSTPNINEESVVTAYATKNFKNIQLVKRGLYMDKIVVSDIVKDTLQPDTTLMIDYIGYLPDGFVFDTSLEETARERRIYDSGNSYQPLSFKYSKNNKEELGGTIPAWKAVIEKMKIGEEAYFIADSEYCYGNKGNVAASGANSTLLQAYTPLIFYIHILTPEQAEAREEKEDDDLL